MINCVLIKYGEIFIRGNNKPKFEKMLMSIIEARLSEASDVLVYKDNGRIIVQQADGVIDYNFVLQKLKYVSGIVSCSPCVYTDDFSIENIEKLSLGLMDFEYHDQTTFKVQSRRALKKYPLKSPEINARVGGYILNEGDHYIVDVNNPDVILNVEVRSKVYMYTKIIKGLNGLPYGSSGNGILLLSGGIDSPVAGFLMARRGLSFDCVYFHSPPFTSENAKKKVMDICEKLSEYTGFIRLHVINFTDVMLYLRDNVHENKTTIFLKRAMLKACEIMSEELSAKGLIVGDSLGQVASQTMNNLYVINDAVSMPILRPLLAMDKEDIIKIAKEIETFDISVRPFEDCCTIFVPKHPDLKPSLKVVKNLDSNLTELDQLLSDCISKKELYDFTILN